MLAVILKILSILGIILLVLLGVILVVLLLVLFYPVCYRIKADRQPAKTKTTGEQTTPEEPQWAIHADAKAWWLFGLLRAVYKYPEPGVFKVKLLFFTIYDSSQDKEDDSIDSEGTDDFAESQSDNIPTQSTAANDESSSEITGSTEASNNNIETENPSTASRRDADDISKESENLNIIEKIQYTIQKFCDKIKSIFEKIKDIRTNAAYYKEVLTDDDSKGLLKHAIMRLGKILKSIRPRKLRADIRFGASSPDTTGYVCAAYGMICSHLGKHVVFTPDFEQEILEGNIYAAGHTTVFKILWNAFMLIKDKRLWELRDKLNNKPI